MAVEVCMPKLSDSMTEGTVVSWLRNVGDTVAAGDILAEIETEKSTVDLEAPSAGVIGKICVEAGSEGVAVGTVLLILEAEGTSVAVPERQSSTAAPSSPTASSSSSPVDTGAKGADAEVAEGAPPASLPGRPPGTLASVSGPTAVASSASVAATPLARRMAAQAGLDLAAIPGTGARGKVCKADIERVLGIGVSHTAGMAPAAVPSTAPLPVAPAARPTAPMSQQPAPIGAATGQTVDEPVSRVRRVIADRLSMAKQTVPHFYLEADVTIDRLLATRSELNSTGDTKLSVNDFVVRAAAVALSRHPRANASWQGESIRYHGSVNVCVAVATDNGLVTPVVRDADRLGLQGIATTIRDLAERARTGRLQPSEYDGGTVTISNLGMYGVDGLYAIINPPQACILGIGRGKEQPVVRNGQVEVGTVMRCTLSGDHRVLDGADGAKLLAEFCSLLEEPARMLL